MSALRCQSCEALTTVTWSGRCQACYRRDFDAPVPIDHLVEKHSEAASVTTIARQVRTIRRLRALADGYREQMRVHRDISIRRATLLVDTAKWGHQHELHGAAKERARIVAALRACARVAPDVQLTAERIADAIERGEL